MYRISFFLALLSFLLTFQLCIGLAGIKMLASDESGPSAEQTIGKTRALLSWKDYTQLFQKSYSSWTQQLARQRLFISKTIAVFVAAAKYQLGRSSFYLAINRFSDLTPEEEKRLSGEILDDSEEENEGLMDDQEVGKIISEALLEEEKKQQAMSRRRRRKRSPELGTGSEGQPESGTGALRSIQLSDLVRPPSSPAEREKTLALLTDDERPSGQLEGGGTKDYFDQNELGVDWRSSGCVAPPMDQGICSSCYAVSSISFVEWAFCMAQDRKITPLSAQYIVSCGHQFGEETNPTKYQLKGCTNGRTWQVMDFIQDYGVELETFFPYYGEDLFCPVERNTPRKLKGYLRPNVSKTVRMYSTTSNLDLALKLSPVLISFRMPKNFLSFAGGIMDSCGTRPEDRLGGHSMLVVGSGVSKEDGSAYLLIKNSMGTDWGEGGYLRLKRDAVKECVKEFIWPRLTFPSRKAIARRGKAHEARLFSVDEEEGEHEHEENDELGLEAILH